MDSLILGLEEHKSKSKPRPVTSITRIIHLREGRACGVRGERVGGRRGAPEHHCFSSSLQKNLHRSSGVTSWVIYKCLIMRLFRLFSLSIHQARCGSLCPVWTGLWDKTRYLHRHAANESNKLVGLCSTVKWKCGDDRVATGRGWISASNTHSVIGFAENTLEASFGYVYRLIYSVNCFKWVGFNWVVSAKLGCLEEVCPATEWTDA